MNKAVVRRRRRSSRPLPDLRRPRSGSFDPAAPELLHQYVDARIDRRSLKIAAFLALAAHFVLFLVVIPSQAVQPIDADRKQAGVILRRWQPPAPPARPNKPVKAPVNPVPIPDPTPRDPEPIFDDRVNDFAPGDADAEFSVGLPDAPPGPPGARGDAVGMDAGGLTSPVLVDKIVPDYTPEATRRGIQGTVYIEAVITTEGAVVEPRLIRGLPDDELNSRAIDAVRKWTFKPGVRDGRPVAVVATFMVDFTIH